MQSWPSRHFRHGGFYVPDTFARSPETHPQSLSRFQAFNLRMTQQNSFASDAPLNGNAVVATGFDLLTKGLTPRSAAMIVAQLARERLDGRYTARRSVMQVLPCFDLYWRLHRRSGPHLSVFFTNHVAGMMHRYWGDGVPGYTDIEPSQVDGVYRGFILTAMDLFDHQLGRVLRWAGQHPETVVVVASSMGQGPIPFQGAMDATYVLDDAARLLASLGLTGAEMGLAMYPRICLKFFSEEAVRSAAEVVGSVVTDGGPMFHDLHHHGTSLSFEIDYRFAAASLDRQVKWTAAGCGTEVSGTLDDLGIVVRSRPGGANTAHHTPEGIFLARGAGVDADASREKVSVLDAAPSILDLLGLEPAPTMRGAPSLFR